MIVVVDYLYPDRDSGILYYRRKYPKELRQHISGASPTGRGRVEFKRSLHVADLNAPGAMDSYKAAQIEFDQDVADARRAAAAAHKRASGAFDQLDAPTIAYLAERYRVEALASDEERRKDPDARAWASQVTEIGRKVGFEFPNGPASANWTYSIRLLHATMREAARELRATGDDEGIMEAWGDLAISMASESGFEIERGSGSFADLCRALNDAAATAHEEALRRLDGDLVPTPPMPASPNDRAVRSSKGQGTSLLDLYEKYAAVPGRSPKTVAQWRPYISHLAKFAGVSNVSEITHDHIVSWRNHLRDEVTYRGKPLSAKTINGSYLGAVQALFAWAMGDGLIRQNPALQVTRVSLPAAPKTRGKSFTTDEVTTILKAALQGSTSREGEDLRNAKRWCPWLMAYSGARVNEITQLRKEDIFERDGVWALRITPDAGTVKTKKYRMVPLHSHLRDQGFLEFVEGRPDGPLFYDPSKRRSENAINRQANRLGSKLSEWVRSLGIEGVMPNHAWRHLFINLAVRHGLDARVAKAITGHSTTDVQDKVYLADLVDQVDVLSRELEKIPRFLEVASEPR